MKKLLINSALMFSLLLTFCKANAQININIGLQPVWGPVGYDYVEYYYLPEYELYYDVPHRRYIYLNGGNWVFMPTLPQRFRSINFYSTYKVVVNEPKAYMHFNKHRLEYVKYKHGGANQVVIRDSREPKYFVIKNHPMHGKAKNNNEHGKANANENHNNANNYQHHDNVKSKQHNNADHGTMHTHDRNAGKQVEGSQPNYQKYQGNGGNGGEHGHGKGGK